MITWGFAYICEDWSHQHILKPELPDHYVIVPAVNLGHVDLFMPMSEDGNLIKPSHYRALVSETRETAWKSHISELRRV